MSDCDPKFKFLIKRNSCVKSITKVDLEMYPQSLKKIIGKKL
jgi:hypothetical protein